MAMRAILAVRHMSRGLASGIELTDLGGSENSRRQPERASQGSRAARRFQRVSLHYVSRRYRKLEQIITRYKMPLRPPKQTRRALSRVPRLLVQYPRARRYMSNTIFPGSRGFANVLPATCSHTATAERWLELHAAIMNGDRVCWALSGASGGYAVPPTDPIKARMDLFVCHSKSLIWIDYIHHEELLQTSPAA